jgi:hypothetical protein
MTDLRKDYNVVESMFDQNIKQTKLRIFDEQETYPSTMVVLHRFPAGKSTD